MTEQELNHKILNWLGFTIKDHPEPKLEPTEKAWFDPNGMFYSGLDNMVDLTSDIASCFELILPALKEQGWMTRIQYSPLRDNDTGKVISDWTYYVQFYDVSVQGLRRYNYEFYCLNKESPALALCLTVSQLIDKVGIV